VPLERSGLPVSCAYVVDDIDESILESILKYLRDRSVTGRCVVTDKQADVSPSCSRKGIQLAHVGECTTLKEIEQCPEDCAEIPEEPVCGSDGNVYR